MPGGQPDVGWGRFIRLTALFLGLVALFVTTLTAVYLIPADRALPNAKTSADLLRAEGLFPTPLLNSAFYQQDNLIDALMLDTALGIGSDSAFVGAMAAVNGTGYEGTAKMPVDALTDASDGSRETPGSYHRYWHGYQVVVRPALMLMDIKGIRLANMAFLLLLGLATALTLVRTGGARAALAFGASLLLTGFAVVPLSMQLSSVWYVAMIGMIAASLLSRGPKWDKLDIELFLVLGMLTAFVDLLTAPLLTLGMPMAAAIYVRVLRDQITDSRGGLKMLGRGALAWLTGYAGAWAAKIVLAQAALDEDAIGQALIQVWHRAGGAGSSSDAFRSLLRNSAGMAPGMRLDAAVSLGGKVAANALPLLVLAGFAVAAVIAFVVLWRAGDAPWARASRWAFALLAAAPYAWFLVVANHSFVHYWYSYRIQAVTVFVVGLALALASGRRQDVGDSAASS